MKTTAKISYPALYLACLVMMVSQSSPAQDGDPFVIEKAEFTMNQDWLVLDMVVASEIPNYISIAIDQGFAVPLMFEIEIRSRKRYWLDDRIVSLKQQYLLHRLPMLDAYVVLDINNSQRHYFQERKAAVQFVEVVYNYPMLDINNLAADREYYARARFGIDTDELPLPLKSSSLWDNDWDLKSDWYEWEVKYPAS